MGKRDVSIMVRLTENEKATLEEKAEIADESLSSFVRKIALGYKIIPPKEIGIVQGNQIDVFSSAEKAELEKLRKENLEQEKIIQDFLSGWKNDSFYSAIVGLKVSKQLRDKGWE